jgi:hypothetical protein
VHSCFLVGTDIGRVVVGNIVVDIEIDTVRNSSLAADCLAYLYCYHKLVDFRWLAEGYSQCLDSWNCLVSVG